MAFRIRSVSRRRRGQQTDRAVALILMIARECRMLAWLGRQVRSRGRDRLDAGRGAPQPSGYGTYRPSFATPLSTIS